MQPEIRQISFGSKEYKDGIDLRTKILREPLGIKFSADDLMKEADEIHVGAFVGGSLVGCLLLAPQSERVVKMRQVAVVKNTQRAGVGKKLVDYSEMLSREKGFKEIVLHARETAVPFYLKLGYEVYDEPFTEVTLPHRKMRKSIY